MELSNWIALWCLLMSTLQGISSYYEIAARWKREGGVAKRSPLFIAVILCLGTIITVAFGTWMYIAKPLRPTVTTSTVTTPCPAPSSHAPNHAPTTTGNAKTMGDNSPANTGTGNAFNYGTPPPTGKTTPH